MNETQQALGRELAGDASRRCGSHCFPMEPGQAGEAQARHARDPLEEQFAELRDTWQASIENGPSFAKEAAQGELPTRRQRCARCSRPRRGAGPGRASFDAALQRVLEGPSYATLWDLDRKLLELQQLALQRDKDVAAYQAVVQKAWNDAFERFCERRCATRRSRRPSRPGAA